LPFTLEPALIAKSSIILDVKPWDDEVDLKEMEKLVRGIECDGLLWAKEGITFYFLYHWLLRLKFFV